MKFTYVAVNKTGKRLYGETEAENLKAAATLLRSQGLLPVNLTNIGIVRKYKLNTKNIFGRVGLVEKISFIKNLAVMLKAGFPVSRALRALTEQTSNSTFSAALADIATQVESGQTLGTAMAKYPKIFSNVFVNVIKVGEVSGNLEESLFNLATQLKKDHDLVRKTKGAMIYPAIVLSAMFVVSVLMFTFVLPKLILLFEDFDVELPLLTRIIISVVNIMKEYGIFVLVGFVALVVGITTAARQPKVARLIDKMILKMPLFGQLVQFTNLARFARTLASLLHSGMPILESVKVTGESLNNGEFKQAIVKVEDYIRIGTQLSQAMSNYAHLFPPLIINMVAVGEESGTVDNILLEVAEFYEGEVNQAVSNLSSVMEPLLMIVVGAGVGIIAMGLVMPIYSITQSV